MTVLTQKISDKDIKEEILKAFELFNGDETRTISFKHLQRVGEELGEQLSEQELQEMTEGVDGDGDGDVNKQGCLSIVEKTRLH